MKVHVRTLWSEGPRPLWNTVHQKVALQNYLNDLGFYVLTGVGDSLDVFAISYENPWDIETLMKTLDKIEKSWYKLTGGKKK
jgi:hypothetical protein